MGRLQLSRSYRVWLVVIAALLCGCVSRQPAEWSESFESQGAWQLGSDAVAQTSIIDGALQIHVIEPGQVAWASHEGEWDNFELQVDATVISGPLDNEYGVLVRMDGDQRFYAFSISADGYARVAYYEDGRWTVLGSDWTLTPAITQDTATNTLAVTADDDILTFRVNGEIVSQLTDQSLDRGGFGLYAGAFTEGNVVLAFDNLSIRPLR